MRKLRLKPPANDTRPVRRSLVELTALASRAAGDDVLVMPIFPIAAAIAEAARPEDVANKPVPATEQQATAARVGEPPNEPRPSRRTEIPESLKDPEGTVEMLVQIAKDHQARTLESIRLGLAAALDYARDRARTPMPAAREQQQPDAKAEDNLLAAIGAAAGYRAEAMDLARTNLAATLNFARDVAHATTAAEFVELSSTLARKQYELMLKQAAVLQSFARTVTKPGAED